MGPKEGSVCLQEAVSAAELFFKDISSVTSHRPHWLRLKEDKGTDGESLSLGRDKGQKPETARLQTCFPGHWSGKRSRDRMKG